MIITDCAFERFWEYIINISEDVKELEFRRNTIFGVKGDGIIISMKSSQKKNKILIDGCIFDSIESCALYITQNIKQRLNSSITIQECQFINCPAPAINLKNLDLEELSIKGIELKYLTGGTRFAVHLSKCSNFNILDLEFFKCNSVGIGVDHSSGNISNISFNTIQGAILVNCSNSQDKLFIDGLEGKGLINFGLHVTGGDLHNLSINNVVFEDVSFGVVILQTRPPSIKDSNLRISNLHIQGSKVVAVCAKLLSSTLSISKFLLQPLPDSAVVMAEDKNTELLIKLLADDPPDIMVTPIPAYKKAEPINEKIVENRASPKHVYDDVLRSHMIKRRNGNLMNANCKLI